MANKELDDHALLKIHADRIVKRQIDELVGLAKGALLLTRPLNTPALL